MQRHFDDDLSKLNQMLIEMGVLTEQAIHRSVEALKTQNTKEANSVIEDDQVIDEKELLIDEFAIDLLALYQPMAVDLRFITTAMNINRELERIGDLTVNISQRVLDISNQPLLKPLIDIPRLMNIAKRMVRQAIDSFINHDEKLAKDVILSDRESNELRSVIMKELVYDYMVKDGTTAPKAVPLLLVARDLERICDHATYIAEDVIFMVRAKTVRHHRDELQ